jgi:hypothetical protein
MERAGAKKSPELEDWWRAHKKNPGHVHPSPDEEITQEHAMADGRQRLNMRNLASQAGRVASAIKVGALGYSGELSKRELMGVKAVVDSFIETVEDVRNGH